jgi:hypothetical protein
MKPYKLLSVQALKPEDLAVRYEFCREVLARTENDNDLPAKFIFSDEATFHITCKVNRHNARVWRTESPHVTLDHERYSPEVNVFCAISKEKFYGPSFFVENTVTGNSYLDMLTLLFLPQLEDDSDDFIFQQNREPPHFHMAVLNYLNAYLPLRWTGRAGANDVVWCR